MIRANGISTNRSAALVWVLHGVTACIRNRLCVGGNGQNLSVIIQSGLFAQRSVYDINSKAVLRAMRRKSAVFCFARGRIMRSRAKNGNVFRYITLQHLNRCKFGLPKYSSVLLRAVFFSFAMCLTMAIRRSSEPINTVRNSLKFGRAKNFVRWQAECPTFEQSALQERNVNGGAKPRSHASFFSAIMRRRQSANSKKSLKSFRSDSRCLGMYFTNSEWRIAGVKTTLVINTGVLLGTTTRRQKSF